MTGLEVMLITILAMCAVCLAFVWWVIRQPMPDAVDVDEEQDEQDDERSQRRRC